MPILPPLPRPQRRRIHKIIHATRDKGHARRLMAILLLHEGRTVTDVHHLTGAARSTIGRWLRWYRDEGIDALEALPAGRAPVLPIAKMVTLLVLLMQFSPQDFGYQRSRWCTELLAIKINRLTGLNVSGRLHTSSMVTSYGDCLAQARADLADKRPGLSGENGEYRRRAGPL